MEPTGLKCKFKYFKIWIMAASGVDNTANLAFGGTRPSIFSCVQTNEIMEWN